jgi:hypothetical protein
VFDPYEAGTRLYGNIQEALAITTSSTPTSAVIDADEVMLHAMGADMKIARGPTPDTGAAYNFVLAAGERHFIQVKRGEDKIAAAALSGSGTLYITPCGVL